MDNIFQRNVEKSLLENYVNKCDPEGKLTLQLK